MLSKEDYAMIAARYTPGGPERLGQFLLNRLSDRGMPYTDSELFFCKDDVRSAQMFEDRYTLEDMSFVKDWAVQCIEMEAVSLTEALAKVYKVSFDFAFTTTVCKLMLRSGFVIVGTSGCVDPGRFNKEVGKKLAWEDVVKQLMSHEAFILAERLSKEGRVDLLSLPF